MEFIEHLGWRSAWAVELDTPSRSAPARDESPVDSEHGTGRPSMSLQRISALERLEILGWDEV